MVLRYAARAADPYRLVTRKWAPGIQDSQTEPFVAVLQGTPHVIADIVLGKPEKMSQMRVRRTGKAT